MRLKIDGREVKVPPGTCVKDAAEKAGILVPGLCDHPELTPYGGCRLCLVEIDGIRGYPSSCTMPASEGMVVRTDTPALRELRRTILEMLLSEHPSICLTCDRAGRCDEIREAMRKAPESMGCRYCPKDQRCELQEVVELIGLEKVDLPHLGETREVVRSPFFDRDPNLCILCGRCIRACEDRGLGAISFTFRGFEAGIGTAFGKPLEDSGCRFCGACVDVCPTGSLTERASKWAGGGEETVVTICPYCSSNCQIGLETKKGKLLRARPEKSKLCVRGRFGLDYVNHRDRLRRPLVRKRGSLMETSWDDALDYAAKGLSPRGGEGFSLFTSGILTNEALYLAKKFASDVMGGQAVAPDVASLDCRPEDLPGPFLVVGDVGETNPATELFLRSRKPVVLSSVRTLLAQHASRWLKPWPGEEAFLLAVLGRALKGQIEKVRGLSSEEIVHATQELKGASVVVGPNCSPEVRKAASDLVEATGGKLCLLGLNCNSRGAAALGLNLHYEKALLALTSGNLRSAYFAGCNLARVEPQLAAALSGLEFLVVQDLFLTETAKLADVVLPASSFAEGAGSILGSGGRILSLSQAKAALGRPDWQILAELGRKMGACGLDFRDIQAVQQEMLPSLMRDPGPSFLDWSSSFKPSKDAFLLVEGPSLYQFGSGTRTSKIPDLQYLTRIKRIEINPEDAKKMGIKEGDPLRIDLDSGSIKAEAKVSRRVSPGVLHLSGLKSRLWVVRVRRDV